MKWLALLAFVGLANAAPPSLQWDASDHGGELVVSGGSLARMSNFGPAWETARSFTPQTSGVRTVTFGIDTLLAPASLMVGVTNGITPISASLGSSANSVGYWSNGNTLVNGAFGVFVGAYSPGDTVGVQADLDANTVKFSHNGGAWSSAISIAAMGSNVYVGASAFVYPSGQAALHIVFDDWNDFPEPTVNGVFVGDSITLNGATQETYVYRIRDDLLAQRKAWARVQRFAMNGASWDYAWPPSGYPYTLTQDRPLRVDVARSSTLPNKLVTFAGTNGLVIANHSAAYECARAQDYWSGAITAGWLATEMAVVTTLPRSGLSETVRTAYNSCLVTAATTYGLAIVRLDLNPVIGCPTCHTTFPDGIHPPDSGQQIIANEVEAVLFP